MCATVVPVIITGGEASSQKAGIWRVSKVELMMTLAAMVDRGEFIVAENLKHKDAWIAEMQSVSSETLEGNPDDMVIATALACWRSRRKKVGESDFPLRFD